MSETFKATLRLKQRDFRNYPKAFVFEDVETGKEHFIFPTELAQLLEGVDIEGTWKTFKKGGYPSVRFMGDA